ncbi:MAG: hypothetical protein B6A08_18805 [Sorangiineae bacterium NIC37A_2]|nr:MAG: hypothetical protein B6A08_18805 [Sorangiineae bacterium NIC37A_2]
MTGNEYADLIAAYLKSAYGGRGLQIYREVSLGKSVIGKNRRIDILAIDERTSKAIGVECKYQATAGTVDEKIPYTLQDLAALHIPAFVVYAGTGFSPGVLHLLEGSPLGAYCLPDVSLEPGANTIELDHLIATSFGFWDAVVRNKQTFDLELWKARNQKLLAGEERPRLNAGEERPRLNAGEERPKLPEKSAEPEPMGLLFGGTRTEGTD